MHFGLASNRRAYLEVRGLLEGRRLLEEDAYFNVDTQRCGAYYRVTLI